MNYSKIYFLIVENRKLNLPSGYTELHHILPKSLGGDDAPINLVRLTAREHFVCHLLLVKMQEKDSINYRRMIKAFHMMLVMHATNQQRYNPSRTYEKLRIEFAKAQSLNQSGSGNSQYGKKWITNSTTFEQLKISSNQIIPDGWIFGRKSNTIKSSEIEKRCRLKKKNEKVLKLKEKFTEMYLYYDKFGFEMLKEKFNYQYSKQNLVMHFVKYVDIFKSQNGKQRGKIKQCPVGVRG